VRWAEEKSRFTVLFERLGIEILKETNIQGARQILRISWDEAWNLMARAVRRGKKAKRKRICQQIGAMRNRRGRGIII
jgi:transposase